MNYAIIERGDTFSHSVVDKLRLKLDQIGYIYHDEEPDIVFTVGGDGTMLKGIHKYMDRIEDVVFTGIHTGKLGFYTDFIFEEVDELIKRIEQDDYTDVPFPLLEAHVCYEDGGCLKFYALNEITLINAYKTQHLDVYINDEYFESFQGTGVCISTPSGSSAYNKSLGGALVHPQVKAFQLTEMASINSNVYRTISSPMIFPQEHELVFISRDFNQTTLTVDHMHKDIKNYDMIKCRLSNRTVKFRQYRENDFWDRVRKSFL